MIKISLLAFLIGLMMSVLMFGKIFAQTTDPTATPEPVMPTDAPATGHI